MFLDMITTGIGLSTPHGTLGNVIIATPLGFFHSVSSFNSTRHIRKHGELSWVEREKLKLSTPHGTLGNLDSPSGVVLEALLLSTPHGTLGNPEGFY